jgi:hypothetical protein
VHGRDTRSAPSTLSLAMERKAKSERLCRFKVKENQHVREDKDNLESLLIYSIDDTMMTIHFNADLRPVVGEQVGMLHWIMDPEVSGFIIGYDLDRNQVLICNFDVILVLPLPQLSSANKNVATQTSSRQLGCAALPQSCHSCNWCLYLFRYSQLAPMGLESESC